MVAGAVPPVGIPNTFVEISLVATNGSVGFLPVNLAPVSLIADGMLPSIMPCITLAFERPFSRLLCFWCTFPYDWRLSLILVASLRRHVLPSVYRCVVGRLKITVFSFFGVFVGVVCNDKIKPNLVKHWNLSVNELCSAFCACYYVDSLGSEHNRG